MPRCRLSVRESTRSGDRVEILAEVNGLDRLDVFVNERPRESRDAADGQILFPVSLAPGGDTELLVRGYRDRTLAAVCRESL